MRSLALPLLAAVAAGAALPASAQHDTHAHHGDHTPATSPQSQPPFPAPTAAERAAAFPSDLENMDMRGHMDDNPLVAVFRGDQLERSDDDALGWDLRAGIGRNFSNTWRRRQVRRPAGHHRHARPNPF